MISLYLPLQLHAMKNGVLHYKPEPHMISLMKIFKGNFCFQVFRNEGMAP